MIKMKFAAALAVSMLSLILAAVPAANAGTHFHPGISAEVWAPFDEHNDTLDLNSNDVKGDTPDLSNLVDEWQFRFEGYVTSDAPFVPGSGLNVFYDGDELVELTDMQNQQLCIQANYSGTATFLGDCNNAVKAQWFVITTGSNGDCPCTYGNVGEDNADGGSYYQGSWYTMSVNSTGIGSRVNVNFEDVGDQLWDPYL